ncbi:MAG: ABC transporter ATP-binding protein [Acidimicrobiia bacterium]|nr:MAG: ABC transporter ATP-binding protein [Acidimicrobiia bacterium]
MRERLGSDEDAEPGVAVDGSSTHMVDLTQVTKVYTTGAGDFPALVDADLKVDTGEFVAIVGKSGSGKSTLLNMLTGIDRPTSGVARVNGTVLGDLSEDEVARWRGANVGLVFQFQQLMPTLTIVENVMMPMDFTGNLPTRGREPRAMSLLDLVGIADQADKFPTGLSAGQQQRVAIARALSNDPPLIAADEPTGNLDSHTADSMLELFAKLAGTGKTVVMVTHERDIAAVVDRTISVADGRVLGSNRPNSSGTGIGTEAVVG